MKMENYFFADSDQHPVLDISGKIRLVGKAYGREGFKDGTVVATSSIKALTETTAETASGSVYELGNMSADYVEMMEADEAGMPIIFGWNLKYEDLMDEIPNPDIKLEDVPQFNTHKGYVLYGTDQHGNSIVGEVINQNGNFVTLICSDLKSLTEKEVRCFVVWPSISARALLNVKIFDEVAGLPYDMFETAFFLKCRPRFPAK